MVLRSACAIQLKECTMSGDDSQWRFRPLVNGLILVLSIVGLGGLPESIANWGKLGKWLVAVANQDISRWLLVLVAICLVVWAHDVPKLALGRIRAIRGRRPWKKPPTSPQPKQPSADLTAAARTAETQYTTDPVTAPAKPKDSEAAAVLQKPLTLGWSDPPPERKPGELGGPIDTVMLERQMIRAGKLRANEIDTFKFPDAMQCPLCDGRGSKWGHYEGTCDQCGGTGEMPGEILDFPDCNPCGNTGHNEGRYEKVCNVCHGLGRRVLDAKLLTKFKQAPTTAASS